MESLIRPEHTLDVTLSSIRKTIIAGVSTTDKWLKLNDYFNRLQDEMKKIDAFKLELPLCNHLFDDAIGMVREEMMHCERLNFMPVLEEFIPLKIHSPEKRVVVKIEDAGEKEIMNKKEKMSWMSSVQLGLSTDCNEKSNEGRSMIERDLFQIGKRRVTEGRSLASSNNFPMIRKQSGEEMSGVTSISLRKQEINKLTEEIYCSGQSNFKAGPQQGCFRKQRRCWSPELHRRFLDALQQLGGAKAATPKQVRELMQVDGLTNDEVKSHLQKYRLHAARGLWMSQEQSSKPSKCDSSSPLNLTGSSGATSVSMED